MILSKNIPNQIHSKERINIKCDVCGAEHEKRYDQHIKSNKIHKKDLCRKCASKSTGGKRKGKDFLTKEQREKIRIKQIEQNKIKYPKLTLNCGYCLKEFTVTYARRKKAKYCCRDCQIKSIAGWNEGNDSRKNYKCIICSKEFKSYAQHYTCSPECYSEYMSQQRIGENNPAWIPREDMEKSKCPTCGTVFSYSRNGLHKGQKRLFCSLKCSKIKGGGLWIKDKEQYIVNSKQFNTSLEYVKNPYPPEWKNKLKNKIKGRDNHCCQLCNSTDKLEIHHKDDNKQNCDEDNLITLCKKCHNLTKHNRGFWQQLFTGLDSRSKIVKKGWGLEIHYVNNDKYCLKHLIFFKGKRFSQHKHFIKQELWVCTWGKFECYIKNGNFEDYFVFKKGDKIEIMPNVEHQLQAITNCIITEVSTTDYPEDSIRIEKGD